LDHPVETAFSVGNYLGLSTEDFIENMACIAEEMAYDLEIKVKSIVELVSESLVL
jgi:hypothetical protein